MVFNLIMAGAEAAWESDQVLRMDASRVGEHSDPAWGSRSVYDSETPQLLNGLPSLVMYEMGCQGSAAHIVRFGFVREVKVVGRRVVFRLDERGHFSRASLPDFWDRLGLDPLERGRTHWAIKDGSIPHWIMELVTPIPFGSQITEVTRHAVLDALLLRSGSYHGKQEPLSFLKKIWDLSSMPSTDTRFSDAEADIWQHTINNDDWDDAYLLKEYLGLTSCSDRVFFRFVEAAVHPTIGDRDEVSARVTAAFA